jgi:peptide/nickel transport system substrate-binding protein
MNLITKLVTIIFSALLTIIPSSKLTEGVVGQPRSFLPSKVETQTDKTISSLIFRGLFKYDIYGGLVPDLADTWEVSEDGLVYTIKMKEGQKWTDGSEITSDDLIYTSFKVGVLSDVATDKVDAHTVRFTLPNKFSPFLSLLTTGLMKSNAEEEQNGLMPTTSGQFRVIDIKRSGPLVKEIVLYNKDSTQDIRKLSFRYYANDEELVIGAKLGEFDSFVSQSEHVLEGFENYKFPIQGVYYGLFFNMRDEKFSDLEFRKKLRSALPVEEMTNPLGIPVQGVVSKSIYTKDSINTDHFNLELSEEVINQEIVITVPDITTHVELAKRITTVWEDKFNIPVDLRRISPEDFLTKVIEPREFEVLLYGQEVGRDPDRYVYWHSTKIDSPNLNITGFEHVRADRALEEGRNNVDFAERQIHYHELQDVIEEQVPAVFMYHPYANYYVSSYIEGIGEKYTYTLADRFLDFSNWKIIQTN